jgi:hypothetical protein
MDEKEAGAILAEHLNLYRSRSHAELAAWVRERRIDTAEVVGQSGKEYQIEVVFFWDDKPDGDVLVIGSIDDGRGIRASLPRTDSFALSPEGAIRGTR